MSIAFGKRASSQKPSQPQPEINITPLVDVVLVLLIIFMVIAPSSKTESAWSYQA